MVRDDGLAVPYGLERAGADPHPPLSAHPAPRNRLARKPLHRRLVSAAAGADSGPPLSFGSPSGCPGNRYFNVLTALSPSLRLYFLLQAGTPPFGPPSGISLPRRRIWPAGLASYDSAFADTTLVPALCAAGTFC